MLLGCGNEPTIHVGTIQSKDSYVHSGSRWVETNYYVTMVQTNKILIKTDDPRVSGLIYEQLHVGSVSSVMGIELPK